jgi:pyruvate,orthophosphate dikinase
MTSHAAVVARGMGKCCVSGCTAVTVNVEAGTATIDGHILRRGDVITLDGSTGNVILGEVERVPAGKDADFMRILDWADEFRQMNVLANVDTPEDARRARQLGGQGIGLCRTEHMFFNPVRVIFMREMILAASVEERDAALEKLYEFQRDDMTDLFMEMDGLPVTIRLLVSLVLAHTCPLRALTLPP